MTQKIEIKWQKIWDDEDAFKASRDSDKQKYYVLEMLPYPSGKIHVGHLRNYSIGDTLSRFMRAMGYNVLHPMGWDAFGLPAENAAISNNAHPATWTYSNIDSMRQQLKSIGLSYDWNCEITSCDPEYYKHEQKFFLDLYKKDLAYQKESLVNWDPVDQTVLANEQVLDGRGWRSGALVEKKHLKQWFLRITNYAEELLTELPNLTGWPENVRLMQEKWISKSIGANFKFKLTDREEYIEVFSTRPETIFGASFLAVAYNHPAILNIAKTPEIEKFIQKYSNLSNQMLEKTEKEAVFTGLYVAHPFEAGLKIPVIIANFVLMDYGTGALFGCPAHDQRDYEIAIKMDLPIKSVLSDSTSLPYTGSGVMTNSRFLNGMSTEQAKEIVINEFQKLGIGYKTINYRLKDWGISRQRFWGCPVPIIYCKICGIVPVPESCLPVGLPSDVTFTGLGNPLDHHPSWKYTKCPTCASDAVRETDTFDTFFESSWYFTRYCDNQAPSMTNKDACDYWLPVDQYIGGVEHAVMHLLYARFFTKLMQEQGLVSAREPFTKLLTQGMVLHATYKDNENNFIYPDEVIEKAGKLLHKDTMLEVTIGRVEKMSKSKKNVVDLETILAKYGADSMRLFVLSDSPPEKDLEWSSTGIEGCSKFIAKLFQMCDLVKNHPVVILSENTCHNLVKLTHYTIKHVADDIIHFRLNKAIARLRELFNQISDELAKQNVNMPIIKESYSVLIRLLNYFIPHVTEEIWEKLGNEERLYHMTLPQYDESILEQTSYVMAVQVNGKLRGTIESHVNASDDEIKTKACSLETVQKYLENAQIKKIIIVPKKIINIVI